MALDCENKALTLLVRSDHRHKVQAPLTDVDKLQNVTGDAVVRWLSETSEKATHHEDKRKLIWLHAYLGKRC